MSLIVNKICARDGSWQLTHASADRHLSTLDVEGGGGIYYVHTVYICTQNYLQANATHTEISRDLCMINMFT